MFKRQSRSPNCPNIHSTLSPKCEEVGVALAMNLPQCLQSGPSRLDSLPVCWPHNAILAIVSMAGDLLQLSVISLLPTASDKGRNKWVFPTPTGVEVSESSQFRVIPWKDTYRHISSESKRWSMRLSISYSFEEGSKRAQNEAAECVLQRPGVGTSRLGIRAHSATAPWMTQACLSLLWPLTSNSV